MNDISVVVRTHAGDDADALADSIRSVCEQTRRPAEILVVEGGPLTEVLEDVLAELSRTVSVPIRRIPNEPDPGRAAACRIGVEEASGELVAIQDADDLSVPERFEWSLAALEEHDAALVGGYVEEFVTDPAEPYTARTVPCEPAEIRATARLKNPVNHSTVLARREALIEVGNYRTLEWGEDYELWARLLANGFEIVNVPKVLAKFRGGPEMYRRRGGLENVREELSLQRQLVESGLISRPRALGNFLVRSVPELAPARVREQIFTRLLREPTQPN